MIGGRGVRNKGHGDHFEEVFVVQARLLGMYARKNHLSARIIGKGRTIVTKSELDFKLLSKELGVAEVDCKSFDGDYFVYSDLKESQIELAALYNYWNVPSGFVVWFRGIDRVVFYKGAQVDAMGPRTRFIPDMGIALGTRNQFNLRRIYATTSL